MRGFYETDVKANLTVEAIFNKAAEKVGGLVTPENFDEFNKALDDLQAGRFSKLAGEIIS